jgi:hypothetical protein
MNVLRNIYNKLFYTSADDKLARYLLSHVNLSTEVSKGYRLYDSYIIIVNDVRYECRFNACQVDDIEFESKFFSKLYDRLKEIYYKNQLKTIQEDIQKEKIRKSIEFKLGLQTHGGIRKILDNIAEKNENAKFSKGKMYIRDGAFIAHSPTDTDDLTSINSIYIDLKTLEVTMHRSYEAFSTYKKFEGKIQNLDDVQKYIDIVNNRTTEEYKNKQEFVKAL